MGLLGEASFRHRRREKTGARKTVLRETPGSALCVCVCVSYRSPPTRFHNYWFAEPSEPLILQVREKNSLLRISQKEYYPGAYTRLMESEVQKNEHARVCVCVCVWESVRWPVCWWQFQQLPGPMVVLVVLVVGGLLSTSPAAWVCVRGCGGGAPARVCVLVCGRDWICLCLSPRMRLLPLAFQRAAGIAARRLVTLKDFQAQFSRGHHYSNSVPTAAARPDMLNTIKLLHVGEETSKGG